ncbi:loricrin-like [Mytilus edulis]|uniref:loricrin-like n=1 Tax=Mytilus edulis TaxID=6550 RepID=UPI0039EEA96A
MTVMRCIQNESHASTSSLAKDYNPLPSLQVDCNPWLVERRGVDLAPTRSTVATTTGNVSGGGQGAGGCPPFDVSTCDMSCVVMDSSGCLSCNCPLTTVSSGSNTTVAPVTTQSPQGSGGCPAYDASSCDMSCVAMDSNGCLSCHCPDTTVASVTTTAAASGTTASSGGGQGAGGCPTFDVSTCDMNCVSMDSNGCLGCNCPVTTVAPASTAAPSGTTNAPSGTTSGGNGNNGGCPAFDANQCDIKCTKMDVNGCLHCECPVSNNSTVNTFGPGTLGSGTGGTSGNNGGCSAINPGCDISCLQINSNGCVICSCKSTSIKPLVLTTKAHVTLPTTRAPVTTTAILTTKVPMATTDSNVCPPIRCVAPCNVGITFGPDNCPICKCKN